MVRNPFEEQARNGVMVRRTIDPSRFDVGSAQLNSLGRRDVAILAERFTGNPGTLTILRGDAGDALYTARVAMVRSALVSHGVDGSRMQLTDMRNSSPSRSSVEVIKIYEHAIENPIQSQTGEILNPKGGSEASR